MKTIHDGRPLWRVRPGSLLIVMLAGPVAGQVTSRASVATSGSQGNANCFLTSSISAHGHYVAFGSSAENLVAGDTNGVADVFVHDRQTGTTDRVSVGAGGTEGNLDSGDYGFSISADGRYVAFDSSAWNLVSGDTNGFRDIFVRDRQSGTTERVSVDSAGTQETGGWSDYPSISANGRYVAFESFASNLVSGDTNGFGDIFVHDRQTGTTERVSVDSSGAQGNQPSGGNGFFTSISISADGRYVAFESTAGNLVSGDTNGFADIFVRDRQSGTTERVSVDSGGAEANYSCDFPAISADGRYVAFWSLASNLVAGDTNGFYDVFVHDRQTGITERVSVDSSGAQENQSCGPPRLSADGRYAAFNSLASNLVSGDTNGFTDIFVRDRQSGTTERVSVDSGGAEGNSDSWLPCISDEGRFVAFSSFASNLVGGDTNGFSDVLVRDRDATGFTSLCDPGLEGVIPCPCSNPPGGSGRGCDNFGAGPVDSGTLTATGVAHLQSDTIVLTATGENNSSTTVFWTGKLPLNGTGIAHGAGVRCVTTALKRLYPIPGHGSAQAVGGTISRPGGLDTQSVSARTAAIYGTPILPGETRFYFTLYRDPRAAVPCGNSLSTVNLTNTGAITWAP